MSIVFDNDLSVVLAGEAGQGLQTIEQILARVLHRAGYHVFTYSEFMSRIRGGCNSTEIRIAGNPIGAFRSRIDILIPFTADAFDHLGGRLSPRTLVLGDRETLHSDRITHPVPFEAMAAETAGAIAVNVVAAGVLLGLVGVDQSLLFEHLKERFASKGTEVVAKNIAAAEKGHQAGSGLARENGISVSIPRDEPVSRKRLFNGSDVVSLGALAGGCNFLAAYPMSPSTGVLTFLAQHARELGIIVEQAEDEIAGVNMALGAWFAGCRGLANSAGGGFALMCETVSLAGMIESPLVIHIAQRPGPATGLPTRTEQGDLELALYSGHGEFPRVIYAPGTLEEAFYLTQKAFNIADAHQVPVFVLTDQFLLDSYGLADPFDPSRHSPQPGIAKTGADYKRYALTDKGVSPRGVPGYGDGLVCLDSDEHDEEGHITEDLALRADMVRKRLRKGDGLIGEAIPPTRFGPDHASTLVVCWGSNAHVVREAIQEAGLTDTAMLHFSQVYPLPPSGVEALSQAARTIVVENNATGQFAGLLKRYGGIDVSHRILKYDGLPFSVEEVANALRPLVG
jgi:2-oxoglutarate/2-oxoacid ferredoxin oxidoreductase subunit alpha